MQLSDLTDKERQLLTAIHEGMDSADSGWLHEVTPFSSSHMTAGVLGSLIEKGLATSDEDTEGPSVCFWVETTKAGVALFDPH